MGTFRLLARRAAALAALSLSVALAGCVTYPASYYSGQTGHGDYYYADDYYDDYYGGYYGGFAYHSIFWPTWGWYDPWYWPGHYYGINYSPGWYGLSFGWYGGYGGYPWRYHHYSPYRNSWGDNHAYYGGTDWRHGHRDSQSGYRFGSARNEAERIASAERARPQYGDGAQSSAPQAYRGNRSRGIDYGDGRVRHDARDAAWRQPAPGAYARDRSAPRSYDWRTREGDRGAAPRTIDSRAFGAGRPDYGRAPRDVPQGADAYSRSRDMTPYYERPTPRATAPQYAAPRTEALGGARPSGPSRGYGAPAPAPSRSFSPPSPPPPPPRMDTGGSSRGESGRSREPD